MFKFKKALLADNVLIQQLASRIWEPTYGDILPPDQLEYMFHMMYDLPNIEKQQTEEGHVYFLIYKDNVPCAFLSIETMESNHFHFQKVYALPSVHGTGVGRYIIEQGIAYLKSIHPTPFIIELNVNRANPAIAFYEHMGFTKVRERDFHIGSGYYMNDYVMQLKVE